jgi:hypothetical protein
MSKMLNFSDDFETLYLRCEYLKKIPEYDTFAITKYQPIVRTTAHLMFDKLKFHFNRVGFDINDIIQITNSYLLAYMGLYSLKHNKNNFKNFVKKYQDAHDTKPPEKEIERIERNNLICFLRQRLQHCSTLCERKGRNIRVDKTIRRAFAETADSKPASDDDIATNFKKLGYRPVTCLEFKEAKKRALKNHTKTFTDLQGFTIVEICLFDQGIDGVDYQTIVENNTSYYSDPEQLIIEQEEQKTAQVNELRFNKLNDEGKAELLNRFIENNKSNRRCRKEIFSARQLLKQLNVVV